MVSAMFLASCADDVYDPSKEPQTPPAENPLGEGFTAPEGFGWSMTNSINLNVEIKDDEFNGQYKYLIEVFTNNPLGDENATPIAAGTASKNTNYTTTISIPAAAENLYIRQTDPKQRKEVYAFQTPENGGSMDCKLYYTGTGTRATGNTGSAFEAAKQAGFVEPEHKDREDIKPSYDETKIIPEVPAVSDGYVQYNPGALNAGAKFIIGTEHTSSAPFKDNIRVYNNSGRATVFVQGVWDLSNIGLQSSLDIYIMNGGKIIGSNDITFGGNNTLTIQSGGSIESKGGTLNLGCPAKVYGSITATNVSVNEGTPEIYIGENGSIKAIETAYFNKSQIFNYGALSAGKLELVDATVLNKSYIEKCEDILINSSEIFNYGDIQFNGTLTTNNNTGKAVFINHYQATLTGTTWDNGASVYNDGLIQLTNFRNPAVGEIYNSCALIIRSEFTFVNLILDNGSITSDWSKTENEWLPVPTITCNQKVNIKMKNSSIIKADNFTLANSPNTIVGEQGEISMLKTRILTLNSGGKTSISGNLVFEGQYAENYPSWKLEVTCAATGYDESKHSIESCSGIINEGNEGGDPSDPEFPIIVEDATNYTFAFEDNWPTYGDFDLNDIVATIDEVTFAQHGDGSVGVYTLNGTLQAVGASKKLGLGIQFLGFAASNVVELKGIIEGVTNNATLINFESNQSNPVVIICNDAHHFIGNSEDDRGYVNTLAGNDHNRKGAKFEISIEFKEGTVKSSDLNINQLDVFVISRAADAKAKRTEVHVAGYAPTDLANTKLFGQGNDKSSATEKRYYLSSENLSWGVVIPTDFAWPLEYKNIKDVYTNFTGWVTSGGKESKDWYNNHNGQVFKK